jgi:P27 family predicted phage terminase small subunit
MKSLRGNPGRRPLNQREPKAQRGQPPRPNWLGKRGNEAWVELSQLLDGMQVLTLPDGPALALLCATYDDYREARDVVDEHGMTYESQNTLTGAVIVRPRPEVAIMSDAAKRMRNLLVEFGLTPSARSRLHVGGDLPVDPLEEFLHGGAGG